MIGISTILIPPYLIGISTMLILFGISIMLIPSYLIGIGTMLIPPYMIGISTMLIPPYLIGISFKCEALIIRIKSDILIFAEYANHVSNAVLDSSGQISSLLWSNESGINPLRS